MKVIKVSALWCSSCIIVNNYWYKLIELYPNFEFIELDLDFDEEEVKKLSIGSKLPEIIIFKDNREIKRIIGEKSKEELESELNEIYENENI